MLSQAIGASLTHALFRKRHPVIRNVAFWLLFCVIGHPVAILWYYRDMVINAQGGHQG